MCLYIYVCANMLLCKTHITMKTMSRLIDDLCQVKAALIFMANHTRYVPRNFTIDFAYRIFHFICGTRCNVSVVRSCVRRFYFFFVPLFSQLSSPTASLAGARICKSGLFAIILHTKRIKNQIWPSLFKSEFAKDQKERERQSETMRDSR